MSGNQGGDSPRVVSDPIVELYKKDVDRTLIRENLKLSPQERLEKLMAFLRLAHELRAAGRRVS